MRRRFQGRASGDDVRAPHRPPSTRLPRVFRHPPNNARLHPVYRVRTHCNLECSWGHPFAPRPEKKNINNRRDEHRRMTGRKQRSPVKRSLTALANEVQIVGCNFKTLRTSLCIGINLWISHRYQPVPIIQLVESRHN